MRLTPRLTQSLPWLAIAALGLWVKLCYGPEQRTRGQQAGAEQARSVAIATSAKREDSLRAAFAVERRTLQTELARWREMQRRVVTRWDTLTVPGPERVLVKVDTLTREPTMAELIEQANRTINACQLALGTCDARVANLLAGNDSLARSVSYWRRQAAPSLWQQIQQLPGRLVTTSALVGAGFLACKIGG